MRGGERERGGESLSLFFTVSLCPGSFLFLVLPRVYVAFDIFYHHTFSLIGVVSAPITFVFAIFISIPISLMCIRIAYRIGRSEI